jgi:hypothetical protein
VHPWGVDAGSEELLKEDRVLEEEAISAVVELGV